MTVAADLVLASTFASVVSAAPFDDAVAVWHMKDGLDSGRSGSQLTPVGDAELGVPLDGAQREESLSRGGDGYVARFSGGYLSAGQGAGGALNLTGKALTLCLRLRDPSGRLGTPLFSKYGGHERLVYNLFSTDLGDGVAIGFELGLDWNERPLQVSVPVRLLGPTDWHDVIVRYSGAKLELFVDGVLVDEEWPAGSLRTGCPEPCLLGAESCGGEVKAGFTGLMDHAALWDRALTDDELAALSGGPQRAARRDREILGPPRPVRQYWRPRGHNTSVGDCMPFYHDGVFHLYYLFDRRHHGSKWGGGAHQWAHLSTRDLVHWDEHPIAVPITDESEWSICTGSVFNHNGRYYAFYATRRAGRTEQLSLATSRDGIRFGKERPCPIAWLPESYDPGDCRDPKVFASPADGLFHMIVTSRLTDGRGGCLAQLVSRNLRDWRPVEPLLVPGRVTDCPDIFEWNGWWYLLAEHVYWMALGPEGPWLEPAPNRLDVLYVPKTDEFAGDRRFYASWLPDPGQWGGSLVFREMIQFEDGRLGTRFLKEVMPPAGPPVPASARSLAGRALSGPDSVALDADDAPAEAEIACLPGNCRISFEVRPGQVTTFGLRLPSRGGSGSVSELRFTPLGKRVEIGPPGGRPVAAIDAVDGLDAPFSLDLMLYGNIVDACIGGCRTIIARRDGSAGDRLVLFCESGTARFAEIRVRPLE